MKKKQAEVRFLFSRENGISSESVYEQEVHIQELLSDLRSGPAWIVPPDLNLLELPDQKTCVRAQAEGLVLIIEGKEQDVRTESSTELAYLKKLATNIFFLEDIGDADLKILQDTSFRQGKSPDNTDISTSRGRMLAAFTHELRTPLNSIQGMIELSFERNQDSETREYLGIAKEAVTRLMRLINEIIDYSRMSEQGVSFTPIPFDTSSSLKTLLLPWVYACEEKNIHFLCQFDPGVSMQLVSDEGRLHQCLSNLVSNALKFTDRGSIEVETLEVHGELLVRVKNSGTQIPEEVRDHIFQPFYQGQADSNRRYDGVGIGLTISRFIAESLGGSLSLKYSTPEETCFELNIPITEPKRGNTTGTVVQQAIEAGLDRDVTVKAVCIISDSERIAGQIKPWTELLSECVSVNSPDMEIPAYSDEMLFFVHDSLSPELSPCRHLLESGKKIIVFGYSKYNEIVWRRFSSSVNFLRLPFDGQDFIECIGSVYGRSQILPTLAKIHTEAPLIGIRVLVVEDDGINRLVFKKHIEKMGGEVWEAGNATQAFELLKGHPFDICCLDIGLPGISGFEIARKIRDGELEGISPNIPIIAITAYSSQEDAKRMHISGINAILIKPVRGAQLERTITQILSDFKRPEDDLDLPGILSRTTSLVRQGRADLVEKSITKLKNDSSAYLGEELKTSLFKLLLAVRREDLQSITNIVPQIKQEFLKNTEEYQT